MRMHRPGRQGLTGNFFTTSLGNKVSKANPATFDFTTTTLPEVDVMITIFCDFCQFSAKKLAFFLYANVMINFFQNLALY
jgi:hypothetical protein